MELESVVQPARDAKARGIYAKLLTTGNRGFDPDRELFRPLDLMARIEREA